MILYSLYQCNFVVLCCTRACTVEAVFRHIPLLTRPKDIFFANFVSGVLTIFAFGCASYCFYLGLVYLFYNLLRWILGSISEEMLYRAVRNVVFVWRPLC